MEVINKIVSKKNTSLALGYFDGVHIAHREIIKTLVENSKKNNTYTAVISFSENPINYFENIKTQSIQTSKDKEIILDAIGVNYFYELDFEEYKDMEAIEFLKLLINNFSPKEIVVGYDFTFGKNKTGNVDFLKKYEQEFNYKCVIIPQRKILTEKISSSFLRKALQRGALEISKQMLGRYFSIRNSVLKGNGIATSLGCPTANLQWPINIVKLPYGLYYGYAQIDTNLRPALISWGIRPTLTEGVNEVLEVHVYGINKNLYGKIINVLFDKKIRNEIKFPNKTALKSQIQEDYKSFLIWVKKSQKISYIDD